MTSLIQFTLIVKVNMITFVCWLIIFVYMHSYLVHNQVPQPSVEHARTSTFPFMNYAKFLVLYKKLWFLLYTVCNFDIQFIVTDNIYGIFSDFHTFPATKKESQLFLLSWLMLQVKFDSLILPSHFMVKQSLMLRP